MAVIEFTEEKLKEAKSRIENGESQNSVAKSLGTSQKTLKRKLVEAGLMEEETESTPKNKEVQSLSDDEIKVLKMMIKERQHNIELFHEYRVYEELSKVPTDTEQVRSAFNMSKETTERLKKYASVRRLPLQDLVELAVINLLDQYEGIKK